MIKSDKKPAGINRRDIRIADSSGDSYEFSFYENGADSLIEVWYDTADGRPSSKIVTLNDEDLQYVLQAYLEVRGLG